MNDPVYVEMAQALADRVLVEAAGQPLDAQLTHAFRTVLTRRPDDAESSQLRTFFDEAQGRYAADAKAAKQVVGKRDLPAGTASADWAAWFNVAHVLLNLDEAITKN
jgi:hypothetical protein